MAVKTDPRQRWLLALSILISLALTAMPLPGLLTPLRPDWLVITLIYWCLFGTRYAGVSLAFVAGLLLDVLYGTLLGQHALAMVITCYIPLRLYLRMRVFSWLQLTASVFAMLCLYQFLLFWINGVAGLATFPVDYWAPVLTGTVIWPVVMLLLDGLRLRVSAP